MYEALAACANETEVMLYGISIMVIGLSMFALAALLVPDGFAMPIDDDGNL